MSLTLDGTNGLILPSALGTASGGTGLGFVLRNASDGLIFRNNTKTG